MSRRRAVVLLAAAAAVPAPAHALTATVTRDPGTVSYFGAGDPRTTGQVIHRLDLQAGADDEQFLLGAQDLRDDVAVSGPLTLVPVPIAVGHGDDFGFPGRDGCPSRAVPFGDTVYAATLPASASARITYTEPGPASAPRYLEVFQQTWTIAPRTEYSVQPYDASGVAGVAGAAGGSRIAEPPVVYAGLLPRTLGLFARVGGKRFGARTISPVVRRRRVILTGTLRPGAAGVPVTLWRYAPGEADKRPIATVRTDATGAFVYRGFRPKRTGRYELLATYAGDAQYDATRSPCGGPQLKVKRAAST